MRAIGFATKFYTLWDIETEDLYTTVHTANGERSYKSGSLHKCFYIKNISTDLTKVESLYPNVTIDETLRGKSQSFEWTNGYVKVEYADDVFERGYNKGTAIAKCSVLRDLKWAFANEYGDIRRSNIELALNNIGAFVYNGDIYDSKELLNAEIERMTEITSEKNRVESIYKSMINGGVLTTVFTRNLNTFGLVHIDGVTYLFKDFTVCYYNGYEYGLPTIKGVGKRIKNKSLELTVKTGTRINCCDDENETCLIVESFKILK